MKKFFIFFGILLGLFGCDRVKTDNFKTTKELCLTSQSTELIRQKMRDPYQSGLEAEIREGLEQRDVSFLKCLLDYNYDEVRQRGEQRPVDTILTRAIVNGWNTDNIMSLLESVKDINIVNSEEKSPLMLACSRGDLELVRLLISKGARINFLSEKKETPLSAAVSSGNLELVKFLIKSGAGKNLGNSILSKALALNDQEKAYEIANYLLDIGVKISTSDLTVAAGRGLETLVDRILASGLSLTSFLNEYTPLMAASQGGHVNIIKKLLKTKAGSKYYVLEELCSIENGKVKGKMIPMGLNQTRNEAFVSKDVAASDGLYRLLRPNKNTLESYESLVAANALLYAVNSNNTNAVKLLLDAGMNPNYDTSPACPLHARHTDVEGCLTTPLIMASERGNTEMIKLLYKHGANLDYECKSIFRLRGKEETRTAFSVSKDEETRNLLAQLGATR